MTAQQLKNSILQMAVQGKLVPQDPNEEPASALLQRIREEKEKLIKEKKAKREKNPSVIFRGADNTPYEKIGDDVRPLADEVLFEIPDSWEWVRLGSICEIARGGSPRPIKQFLTESSDGINWIKIGDSDKGGKYINHTKEKIIPAGVSKSRMVHAGDFLLTNSMSFGRPYILNVDGCIHDGWLVLSGYSKCYNKDFLYYMLSSRFAYFQFCDIVSGAVVKNLNSDKVAAALFPVPPLEEQRRIVKMIETVEPLIEEYEKAEKPLADLQDNFASRLKKSILQMAVQGKLVPQDPSDEPAEVLLERIQEEKARLVKEGKIKKDKHESVIFRRDNSHYEKLGSEERCIDDEIPFEIPETWAWTRLGSISTYGATKGKINAQDADPSVWGLDLEDIEKGGRLLIRKIVGERKAIGDKTVFHKGDILYSKLRPYLLKILVAPDDGICTPEIVPFSVYGNISAEYIVLFLKSPNVDGLINSITYGVKMPRVGSDTMLNLLVPVPPLAEQARIVQKFDELLPIFKGL